MNPIVVYCRGDQGVEWSARRDTVNECVSKNFFVSRICSFCRSLVIACTLSSNVANLWRE